jgi:hypothetical protein
MSSRRHEEPDMNAACDNPEVEHPGFPCDHPAPVAETLAVGDMEFTSTRPRQVPTVRISCPCGICGGRAALITEAKAKGVTADMIHNYVQMSGGPVGAALGIVAVSA